MSGSLLTILSFWRRATITFFAICLLVVFPAGDASSNDRENLKPAKEKVVDLNMGQSSVIRTDWAVKRVAVTDPKVAVVQVLTPDQVLVQGVGMGTTDLIMWRDDETFRKERVEVGVDIPALSEQLKVLFPGTTLKLSQSQGVVVVEGSLNTAQQALSLHKFFEARGIKKVNMSGVAGVQQVLIHVRVAEVSRTAIRKLGLNAFSDGSDFFGGSLVGSDGGGALNPLSNGFTSNGLVPNFNVAPGVTLFAGVPKWDMFFFLEALAENQYLRVLAEPRLVALSGETASFLAGGEYPIPVVQGTSVGVGSSISIEYRQFGVSLDFRPTVLGDGTIELFIAPEVSELSDVGAVTIQGFQIPAVSTRRAETTLQMKSGQTLAMAGLIRRFASGRNSRIPWVGEIPILGALARSVRHVSGETELVILVTPSLVEPLYETPPVPGMADSIPNDWELYAMGQLSGEIKVSQKASDEELKMLQAMGLANLKGPGAWSRHGQSSPHSTASIEYVNQQR